MFLSAPCFSLETVNSSDTVQEKRLSNDAIIINLSGINNNEYLRFREYLVQYSGFKEIELVQKSASRVVMTYETNSSIALLENNIRQTAKTLGLEVFIEVKAAAIDLKVIGRRNTDSLRFGEW
jgi:hypothetical protein